MGFEEAAAPYICENGALACLGAAPLLEGLVLKIRSPTSLFPPPHILVLPLALVCLFPIFSPLHYQPISLAPTHILFLKNVCVQSRNRTIYNNIVYRIKALMFIVAISDYCDNRSLK